MIGTDCIEIEVTSYKRTTEHKLSTSMQNVFLNQEQSPERY